MHRAPPSAWVGRERKINGIFIKDSSRHSLWAIEFLLKSYALLRSSNIYGINDWHFCRKKKKKNLIIAYSETRKEEDSNALGLRDRVPYIWGVPFRAVGQCSCTQFRVFSHLPSLDTFLTNLHQQNLHYLVSVCSLSIKRDLSNAEWLSVM